MAPPGALRPLWEPSESYGGDFGETKDAAPLTIGLCCQSPLSAGEIRTVEGASLGTTSFRERLLEDVARGVRRGADDEERGWRVQHSFARTSGGTPTALLDAVHRRQLSALILGPWAADAAAARIRRAQIPAVVLLHDGSGLPEEWSTITVGLRHPLEIALNCLRAAGHDRIALLVEDAAPAVMSAAEPLAGWEGVLRNTWTAVLRRRGCDDHEMLTSWRTLSSLSAAWNAGGGPTAVVCTSAAQEAAIAMAAATAGVCRPIATVALGGSPDGAPRACEWMRREATVTIDAESAGAAAVRWVDDLLACPCLYCAGAAPCDRHREGQRIHVPLTGVLICSAGAAAA